MAAARRNRGTARPGGSKWRALPVGIVKLRSGVVAAIASEAGCLAFAARQIGTAAPIRAARN
jgi:hypothetical protein